eukprot:1155522-Pelagomonas_calceolata.AAC.4
MVERADSTDFCICTHRLWATAEALAAAAAAAAAAVHLQRAWQVRQLQKSWLAAAAAAAAAVHLQRAWQTAARAMACCLTRAPVKGLAGESHWEAPSLMHAAEQQA